MKERLDLAKLWIKKAESDLVTGKNSLNISPEPPLDTICFHAQQCAEKYLKAFLTYQGIEFDKTHDLVQLTDTAMKIDEDFEQISEYGEKLLPYAVEARYPSAFDEELTLDRAREAIQMATTIKGFVLSKLPLEKKQK